MARSIDPQPKAVRGFIPARTDEERYLMRHIEDLARTAFSREIARYSGFLSDREQDLARAALGRADIEEGFRFEGGWPQAERRILCLEPEYSYGENPIRCVRLQCRALPGAALPAHKDYLGSLMGLELKREALGDIVLPEDQPGTAYVFALEPAAQLICRELFQAGHTELTTELLEPDERARICGLIINKFRGDVEILRPGLAMLEEKTNRIDQIYSGITGKSAEQFEKELENLPQRMWIE